MTLDISVIKLSLLTKTIFSIMQYFLDRTGWLGTILLMHLYFIFVSTTGGANTHV